MCRPTTCSAGASAAAASASSRPARQHDGHRRTGQRPGQAIDHQLRRAPADLGEIARDADHLRHRGGERLDRVDRDHRDLARHRQTAAAQAPRRRPRAAGCRRSAGASGRGVASSTRSTASCRAVTSASTTRLLVGLEAGCAHRLAKPPRPLAPRPDAQVQRQQGEAPAAVARRDARPSPASPRWCSLSTASTANGSLRSSTTTGTPSPWIVAWTAGSSSSER